MKYLKKSIKLSALAEVLEGAERFGDDCEVTSLVYDSRRAVQGSIFVALPGEHLEGAAFIEDAVQRGALAVITETPCEFGQRFPCIRVPNARKALARVAAEFFDRPADRLPALAVTGTNGKTTVSFMLREIMRAAGRHPGLIGTVRYEIRERVLPSTRTTPESPDIQELFSQMVRMECGCVVMEVSSHALDQYRVEGIPFETSIFTNLTQDHLDYHGSLEEYFKVKARLFEQTAKCAVINADDAWGRRLLADHCGHLDAISYGFDEGAMVRGFKVKSDAHSSSMKVESPWGTVKITLKLIGRFNLSNALAAFAAAASMGIPLKVIVDALANMERVPGRLESVSDSKKKRVFVDYAHTDDALENVLTALREITAGRLIVVFGCGGNRDVGKRALMGGVASRLADYTITTNDNPRTEEPAAIAANIAAGFDSEEKYEVLLARRDAIQRGIKMIGRKDILLVAGKGHESVQEFGGMVVPFDDCEVVREFI